MTITAIKDIKAALDQKLFPTVFLWNRLEGRPRTHDFDRALKAEVRDALWMISKQWQMAEFKAEDNGSPVFAKIHIKSSRLNSYQAAGHGQQVYEENVPLEVKAEQRKIPFSAAGKDVQLNLRLQLGDYWLKLIKSKGLDYRGDYIRQYQFLLPGKDRTTDFVYAHINGWQQLSSIYRRSMDGYQFYQYITTPGKNASDGISHTDPDKTALDKLGGQFIKWYQRNYYQTSDEINNAWIPERLEYQFDCSAESNNGNKQLTAEEYFQGNPEWWIFDIAEKVSDDADGQAPPKTTFTDSFIPAHVEFEGMPDTRWWKFEDSKTNFGDIKPSTTDLSKLLLMEFGLIFANDWFLVPFSLPVGSLANIEGLTVRNNFGETTWIKAAEDEGRDQNSWSMFKMHSTVQNNTLFLAPVAMKVHEGKALEEVLLIRDEMSNMAWGIETIIPSLNGNGDKGNEAALRVRHYQERFVLRPLLDTRTAFFIDLIDDLPYLFAGVLGDKTDIERTLFEAISGRPDRDALLAELVASLNDEKENFENLVGRLAVVNPDLDTIKTNLSSASSVLFDRIIALLNKWLGADADPSTLNKAVQFFEIKKNKDFVAPISYQVMTDVPENWIPFVPVHVENSSRETQLQRASMLRIIEGDEAKPVKIKPQTTLLREGLDESPARAYYIHENEVLRSGTRVSQSFQRTRWTNGEVYVWLGVRKTAGRGEGSSGLAFDQIKNVK